MSLSKTTILTLAALILSGLAFEGCSGCGSGDCAKLTIIDPDDGATITPAQDVSETASGIQIDITCEVDCFDRGDEIVLKIEDESSLTSRYSKPYNGSGSVKFVAMTLAAGTEDNPSDYTLSCEDTGGNTSSESVIIHVVGGEDVCPGVTWITPPEGFSWSRDDDEDGNIEDGFQHDVDIMVRDVADGTAVELFINGSIASSTTVDSGRAKFNNVDFPTDFDITMEIEIGSCTSENNPTYAITGTLDVDLPSCSITDPSGVEWINLSHDIDPMAGIQIRVVISTDEGETVELYVDDDYEATVDAADEEGVFGNVPLEDAPLGGRCLQGQCIDAAGNRGFSTRSCYGVDSTPPAITITAPEAGDYFSDESDFNLDLDGVQIEVSVNSDQLETTVELWSGDCEGTPTPIDLLGTPNTDEEGNATGQVGLGGVDGEVDVCAGVIEQSGNFATDSITVNFDTEAPNVEIVRPNGVIPDPYVVDASDSLILMVDDEDDSDTICQYTVLVDCELPGQPVELYRSTSSTALATATCETCTGDETPDAPDCSEDLPGRAVFSQQQLSQAPSIPYSLHATHTDSAANVGVSSELNVIVDTEPGYVTIVTPTPECESEFRTPLDPYLFDVRVSSDSRPVILTVYDGDGVETYTDTVDQIGLFYIPDVQLRQGTNVLMVCTTDVYGQTGCTDDPDDPEDDCTYTVINIPNVVISAPADEALLGWKHDVDGNDANGFQRNVSVVSDVADGTEVILEVDGVEWGRMNYVAPGITFTAVTLMEGSRAIRALATDERGEGDDTNNVTIDLTPPSEVIDDLAASIISRRGGDIQLAWTAPSDGGSAVNEYDIRCNTTGITNNDDFVAAPIYTFGGIPSEPGSDETALLNDLFVGVDTTYYCAVKSMDAAENRSEMSNVTVQPLRFLVETRQGAESTANYFGYSTAAAGDINNDTVEDFIVGSNTNYAYLFFGDAEGDIPETPDVTLTGLSGSLFGYSVAGIGYFDEDAIPDIAIGAPGVNSSKGAVYIYLGRESWSPSMDQTQADITFIMNDPDPSLKDNGALFGLAVAPAGNFDGDESSLNDFIVTAFSWDSNRGAAFILLGRSEITSGTIVNIPGDGTGLEGDFMIEGFEAGDRFGVSATGVGRINAGDLYDVVVGARDAGGTGKAYLFFGRASAGSGLTEISSANQTIESPAEPGDRFGAPVVGVGDVNSDARNDLMVVATRYGDNEGAAFIFLNSAGAEFEATPSYTITNDAVGSVNDLFGITAGMSKGMGFSTNGDINGDGVNDIFCAAYSYGTGGGASFAFFGGTSLASTTTEAATLKFEFQGSGSSGGSMGGNYIGDINGDGFVDMVSAFPYYSSNRGYIDIYY